MTEEYDEAISMLITDSVFVDAEGNRLGSNPLNAWNTSDPSSYPNPTTSNPSSWPPHTATTVNLPSHRQREKFDQHQNYPSSSSSTYDTYTHPDYEHDDPYHESAPLSDSFLLANVDVSQDAVLITSDLRALDKEVEKKNHIASIDTTGQQNRNHGYRSLNVEARTSVGQGNRNNNGATLRSSLPPSTQPSKFTTAATNIVHTNENIDSDDDLDEFERLEKEALRVQEQLHTFHHNNVTSVPSSVRSSLSSIPGLKDESTATVPAYNRNNHQNTLSDYANLDAPLQPPLSSRPPTLSVSVQGESFLSTNFVTTEPHLSSNIPTKVSTSSSVVISVPPVPVASAPSMPPLDGLSETERQLALIVQSKVQALQEQINRYQTERSKLEETQKLLQEEKRKIDERSREVAKDRDTFKAWRDAESVRFESWKNEVTSKLEKERRVAVRQAHAAAAAARALPDRQERQELESLRTTVTKLRADVAAGETRYKATIERHRTQLTRAQERIQELENQVKKYEEERITFVFGSNDPNNETMMNKSVSVEPVDSHTVRGRKENNTVTHNNKTNASGNALRRADTSIVRNTESSKSRGKSVEPKQSIPSSDNLRSSNKPETETKLLFTNNNHETDNESGNEDTDYRTESNTDTTLNNSSVPLRSLLSTNNNNNYNNPRAGTSNGRNNPTDTTDEYLTSILGQPPSLTNTHTDTVNTSYDPARYGGNNCNNNGSIYAPPAPVRSIGPHAQELPTAIHMTANNHSSSNHPVSVNPLSVSAFSPPKNSNPNHPSAATYTSLSSSRSSPSSLVSSSLATTQVLSEAFRHHLSLHISPQQLRQGVQDFVLTDGNLQIPVIQKRELEGDKFELKFRDGSKIVKFRNGTEKESTPDGTYIVRFSNGDIKRSIPKLTPSIANVDLYYYAAADTIQATYRSIDNQNNYEIFEFPTGQIELHWSNNNKEILFPNGTIKLINGQTGESQSIFPDGRVAESSSG